MSISNQYAQSTSSALHLQGKRLGTRSARVGSVMFAIADAAGILINTFLMKIDVAYDVIALTLSIGWFIFLILFGIALTYFPASYLGTSLAKTLEKDFSENQLSLRSATTKGAIFGAIAVSLVCVPLLLLDLVFVLNTGHGDFFVMVYRAGVATVIASFAGAWTGSKLGKQLIQ
jgi:hypothetical protein